MTRDLVHIELTREEVVAELGAEDLGLVPRQPARRGGSHVSERRQQITRARMKVGHVVDLAVDPAIHGVNQPVAQPAAGVLQKSRREDSLAAGSEDDINRVVHPARHHVLNGTGPIRATPENVRRLRDERLLPVRLLIRLLGKRPLAPVNETVRPEIRPVQIVRTTGQCLPREPLDALIGHAVAISVRQLPDARRSGHIQRAVVPQRPLGKHHLVGKDDILVESPVAIRVLQPHDAMRRVCQLFLHRRIRPR